jgi:formylglycine-generating enzyme required for sulfatase activity
MGEAEDLLGKYAWYYANSPSRSRPVGLLRPNDLGLFDLHGNDWEWCQGGPERLPLIKEQQQEDKVDTSRPLRGGAFDYFPLNARSSEGGLGIAPADHRNNIGFRPARTFR